MSETAGNEAMILSDFSRFGKKQGGPAPLTLIYEKVFMNERANSRLLWPDYAKGLSVGLITIYHTIGGLVTAGVGGVKSLPMISDYQDITHDFRVSVFFLLSGFMAQRTMAKHGKAYVGRSLVTSILWPYVLWIPGSFS